MLESRTPATTVAEMGQRVAGQLPAVSMLTGRYAPYLREMVESALNDQSHEYGMSIAKYANKDTFAIGEPIKGDRSSVSVSVPNRIHKAQGILSSDDPQIGKASREPIRQGYRDLVTVHTHPIHESNEVGLSGCDLRDNVPGPDTYVTEGTRIPPMEIYRAKGAVVFTNDSNRLPRPHAETREGEQDPPLENTHIFSERPSTRPWLHLVERTPTATNLSPAECRQLHYDTLDIRTDGNSADRFRQVREVLGETVVEGIFPLSP